MSIPMEPRYPKCVCGHGFFSHPLGGCSDRDCACEKYEAKKQFFLVAKDDTSPVVDA